MRIKPSKASRHFLKNPYFELVYREAVANALDAGANEIKINIGIDAFSKEKTLKLTIEDDGVGFTDDNYNRFAELLETEDKSHKGLGRLAYMYYFDSVKIDSWFGEGQKRELLFDDNFDKGMGWDAIQDPGHAQGTRLTFGGFTSQKLWAADNIRPVAIKNLLLKEFLLILYKRKQDGFEFSISISLDIKEEDDRLGLHSGVEVLDSDALPVLEEEEFVTKIGLLDNDIKLSYSVTTDPAADSMIATSLCIDGRAIDQGVVKKERLPKGVQAYFILQSSWVDENVQADDARQSVELADDYKSAIAQILLKKVASILRKKLPEIEEQNKNIRVSLETKYPHLTGLFDVDSVGLIDADRAIELAREKFFRAQKKVLEATRLDDKKFSMALEQSCRVLTEYIMYRNFIIEKLKAITPADDEASIHNLIVPKRTLIEEGGNNEDLLYKNNAWLLDDKFMSFKYVLSERTMTELLDHLGEHDEEDGDVGRPDIAFVFSDDYDKAAADKPVDIAVVELKRRGIEHKEAFAVIEQLEERARRLVQFYQTKIQRMWFFGVIDIDDDMEFALTDKGWKPLYSSGLSFYKQEDILIKKKLKDGTWDRTSRDQVPVAMNIISFDAFVRDAQKRNNTFLEVLKGQIKNFEN